MPKKPNKSPWSGRGWPSSPKNKSFYGHDDRTNYPSDHSDFKNSRPNTSARITRVSFKKQNNKHDRHKKNYNIPSNDGDEPMYNNTNNNVRPIIRRGRGRGFVNRGRNSPLPHSASSRDHRGSFRTSDSNWYRIFVPQGHKYTKEFVIGNLNTCLTPFTFKPIMYKNDTAGAVFYVEDQRAAMKIADCSSRITANDGFKMYFRVNAISNPPVEINDALKERLKLAMGKRYVQETNALDLSKFHHDPDLAEDYYCPLSVPNVMTAVLNIVQEHIPHLGALNLDNNKLQNIDKLSLLALKFEKLKILHICENKIKNINFLNSLKNSHLEELRLEGNPFCSKYKDKQDEYISDIRKIFPKLLKLDGIDLPPPIVFDLDDQKEKLPKTEKMYYAPHNVAAQELASRFLQEYFTVFDSENRQSLLEAYHEYACFSLTTDIFQNSKASPYLLESRNLCKVADATRRRKLLKQGKLPVVSFLSEMPRTKHDYNSFTMDLSLVTERMMLVTVTGLFKEFISKERELLRYFNRTFIIVPEGSGFCISNDQLHIYNATSKQEKQFNLSFTVQTAPGPSSAVPSSSGILLTEEVKQQMTLTLSQQTKMNVEWSLKCLEDVQWNFERAQAAFQEAYSLGHIPPNAFTP